MPRNNLLCRCGHFILRLFRYYFNFVKNKVSKNCLSCDLLLLDNYKKYYNNNNMERNFMNVILLGFAFMFLFTAFQTMGNVEVSNFTLLFTLLFR